MSTTSSEIRISHLLDGPATSANAREVAQHVDKILEKHPVAALSSPKSFFSSIRAELHIVGSTVEASYDGDYTRVEHLNDVLHDLYSWAEDVGIKVT